VSSSTAASRRAYGANSTRIVDTLLIS